MIIDLLNLLTKEEVVRFLDFLGIVPVPYICKESKSKSIKGFRRIVNFRKDY